MALADVLDGLEFFGAFTGFWLFLLRRDFRRAKIVEWKSHGWLGVLIVPLEAVFATFCGLLPLWLTLVWQRW